MTGPEFRALRKRFTYYRDREYYMAAASSIAAELIARDGLTSVLELGPNMRPIVAGSDVMEIKPPKTLHAARELMVHGATAVPWPVADRAYGLFVALQVFEHLGTGQRAAFAEACRVARHAIISLPIDWTMADPSNCHHKLQHETVLSWFAPRVPTRLIEGNPGPRARWIYVFEGLDREPADPPPPVPPIERARRWPLGR